VRFADIPGHIDIKLNLISSVRQGRIPHAQMFISREGSFALPLAIAYARYANCLEPTETDSCETCSSCVKFKQLIHPDLHFSFPLFGSELICDDKIEDFRKAFLQNPNMTISQFFAGMGEDSKRPNINVKECRNLIRKLGLKAFEGKHKVLILWLPEFLGNEGNILLKLIEEPPPDTMMILVTEAMDRILTTIVSRTQFIKIPLYSANEIETYLLEKELASKEIATNIALIAEGNMNRAVLLTSEIENPQLDEFRNWMLNCYTGKMYEVMASVDSLADKGKERLKTFLLYGISMIRASALSKYSDNVTKMTVNEKEFVEKFSAFITANNTEDIYNALNRAIYEVERNGSLKLILINLSLKLKSSLRSAQAEETLKIN